MIILGYILIIIASIAKAIMDKVNFHFDRSIFNNPEKFNPLFWNPDISWKNKWVVKKPKTVVGKLFRKLVYNPIEYLFKKSVNFINSILTLLNLPWKLYSGNKELTLKSTILVFITDAWHRFQSIMLFSLFIGLCFIFSDSSIYNNLIHLIITSIMFRFIFTFVFHSVLEKDDKYLQDIRDKFISL